MTFPAAATNLIRLSGQILERGALRYTPAGVPVVEFRLVHQSEQEEAGTMRRVECEMPCVAVGPTANLLTGAQTGDGLHLGGFIAARSLKSRTPVLHVKTIEFLEGNPDGIQTKR